MKFVMRRSKKPGKIFRKKSAVVDSPIVDFLAKQEFIQKRLNRPASLGGGRRIPVITVIERWALCHHLGCVVKYLTRSGGGVPLLADLEKAKWYLERELTRPQSCSTEAIGVQSFTTEDVLEDWGLPFHLSEVLYHLKASKSPSMREESLRQALSHLRAEIAQAAQRASDVNLETNQQQGDAP